MGLLGSYYIGSNLNQSYYISHHGILGQKWGIRRFQNPDGTYTDQGRKRYSAMDYRRQLNAVDKQISRQIYKRENSKAKLDRLKSKGLGKTDQAKTLNKRIKDADELIAKGQAVTKRTMASAKKDRIDISSKKVERMVSEGRNTIQWLSAMTGGYIGAAVSALAIASVDSYLVSTGRSKESLGYITGNKYKARRRE